MSLWCRASSDIPPFTQMTITAGSMLLTVVLPLTAKAADEVVGLRYGTKGCKEGEGEKLFRPSNGHLYPLLAGSTASVKLTIQAVLYANSDCTGKQSYVDANKCGDLGGTDIRRIQR